MGEIIDRYISLSNVVMKRARKIELPENYTETSAEIKELRNLTFTKYKNDYDKALDEIVKALELVSKVDLKELPVENLESIIRLLIAVCSECNTKIKSNNSFIAQLDGDLFDLAGTHEKLEAIDKIRKDLEAELAKLRGDYDKLTKDYIKAQENMSSQLGDAMKNQ